MKNVLVTGGSRGIGREIVRQFAALGYSVAFTYKSSDEAARTLSEECSALAIKADSASPQDIEAAVNTARERLGSIDILVNNAAVSSFSLLTDLSLDVWNNTLAVNLTAPFLYSRAVIPDMVHNKWGRIINISSMWGIVGSSCEAHYSASKAGLIGLTKALAKELGPSGITVNAVAPGLIRTDMNATLDGATLSEIADETPLMRIGEPCEVASAVIYLASDGASFVTGEVMNVSGGYIT